MHEIKKKYLLLSSVNTSVPYPGKSCLLPDNNTKQHQSHNRNYECISPF